MDILSILTIVGTLLILIGIILMISGYAKSNKAMQNTGLAMIILLSIASVFVWIFKN